MSTESRDSRNVTEMLVANSVSSLLMTFPPQSRRSSAEVSVGMVTPSSEM